MSKPLPVRIYDRYKQSLSTSPWLYQLFIIRNMAIFCVLTLDTQDKPRMRDARGPRGKEGKAGT